MSGARVKAALLSALMPLLLAGCGEQPIGSFERAQFIADGGQAHHDVRFTRGCTSLARGEAPRLQAFLTALELRRGDDIVVHMGRTGSDRRDRERRHSLLSAIEPGPARVLMSRSAGFSRRDRRHDAALVQVIRHDQVRVDCKSGGYSEADLALRMPFPMLNCANPTNLAYMAAEKRDLTSPRQLGPARGEPAASAIRRQRAGEVRTIPLGRIAEE
ncbi:hypothetical protein [Roseovarius sp. D22-M7]|uniref:hypothetical protein n=1 Tax=Roseovarius sp. D22-M7 TaxID=3127116 RepID=UPI0030102FA2